MKKPDRIQRPKPERTRPVRSWAGLFTPVPPNGGDPGGSTEERSAAGDRDVGDLVTRSVELGYRVIDEYIRQGQKAARRLSDRSYDPAALTRDTQEWAAGMGRYAADATALWGDFLQVAGGGGARWNGVFPVPPATGTDAPASPAAYSSHMESPAAAPAPSELQRVRVVVAASGPSEVCFDMRGAAARLGVQALRASDPGLPRLSDVTVEEARGDEPVTIRVRVPDGHPPGDYGGSVRDDQTNRAIGFLRVRVLPRDVA